MRNAIINAEFHDFRVDRGELYILRLSFVRLMMIVLNRFTGTCCAGNQKVRHPGNIATTCLPAISFCKGQTGEDAKFLRFQKLCRGTGLLVLSHLQSIGASSDIGRRQIQLDVIRKIDDPI